MSGNTVMHFVCKRMWSLLIILWFGPNGIFGHGRGLCARAPCQNGGQCIDMSSAGGVKRFQCACLAGYEGLTCQKKIDPCLQEPCLNDGECVPKGDKYHCVCHGRYQGTNCETEKKKPNLCESKPCGKHGICETVNDEFICECLPGYNGPRCENKLQEEQVQVAIEAEAEDSSMKGAVIGLLVLMSIFLVVLMLVAIHAWRVSSRRSELQVNQERDKSLGATPRPLPGWMETSNDLCRACFCCCGPRQLKVEVEGVEGVIVPAREYQSMMEERTGSRFVGGQGNAGGDTTAPTVVTSATAAAASQTAFAPNVDPIDPIDPFEEPTAARQSIARTSLRPNTTSLRRSSLHPATPQSDRISFAPRATAIPQSDHNLSFAPSSDRMSFAPRATATSRISGDYSHNSPPVDRLGRPMVSRQSIRNQMQSSLDYNDPWNCRANRHINRHPNLQHSLYPDCAPHRAKTFNEDDHPCRPSVRRSIRHFYSPHPNPISDELDSDYNNYTAEQEEYDMRMAEEEGMMSDISESFEPSPRVSDRRKRTSLRAPRTRDHRDSPLSYSSRYNTRQNYEPSPRRNWSFPVDEKPSYLRRYLTKRESQKRQHRVPDEDRRLAANSDHRKSTKPARQTRSYVDARGKRNYMRLDSCDDEDESENNTPHGDSSADDSRQSEEEVTNGHSDDGYSSTSKVSVENDNSGRYRIQEIPYRKRNERRKVVPYIRQIGDKYRCYREPTKFPPNKSTESRETSDDEELTFNRSNDGKVRRCDIIANARGDHYDGDKIKRGDIMAARGKESKFRDSKSSEYLPIPPKVEIRRKGILKKSSKYAPHLENIRSY